MQLPTSPRCLNARFLTMQETVRLLDSGMQELDRHTQDILVAGAEEGSVKRLKG